jgi:hypothetical protein
MLIGSNNYIPVCRVCYEENTHWFFTYKICPTLKNEYITNGIHTTHIPII